MRQLIVCGAVILVFLGRVVAQSEVQQLSAAFRDSPVVRSSELERYLAAHPDSPAKQLVREQLLADYAALFRFKDEESLTRQMLRENPNDLAALANLSLLLRTSADPGKFDPASLDEARRLSEHGLSLLDSAQKPTWLTDDQFQKVQRIRKALFHGAIGVAALVRSNDPRSAVQHLRATIDLMPQHSEDVCPLAAAYFREEPPDVDNAVWFQTRCAVLERAPDRKPVLLDVAKKVFIAAAGGDEDWATFLSNVEANPLPPAGFRIAPVITYENEGNGEALVGRSRHGEVRIRAWKGRDITVAVRVTNKQSSAVAIDPLSISFAAGRSADALSPIRVFAPYEYEDKIRRGLDWRLGLASGFITLANVPRTQTIDVSGLCGGAAVVGSQTVPFYGICYSTVDVEPTEKDRRAAEQRSEEQMAAVRDAADRRLEEATTGLLNPTIVGPGQSSGGLVHCQKKKADLYRLTVPFGGDNFTFYFSLR